MLSSQETDALLCARGIATPVRFFLAFMICGAYGESLAAALAATFAPNHPVLGLHDKSAYHRGLTHTGGVT